MKFTAYMKLIHLALYNLKSVSMVIAACLLSLLSFSQSRVLTVEKNVKGPRVAFNQNLTKTKMTLADSIMYYTTSYASGSKRTIYSQSIIDNSIDSVVIKSGKAYSRLFKESISSMSKVGNRLVIVCSDHIYIFELQKKKATFISELENKYYFDTSYKLNNMVFLSICYNFHPNDSPNKHVWALLNPSSGKIEKTEIQPENDAMFASFLNSWIDVCDNKLMYARSSEYRISFYDSNLSIVDSIVTPELDNNRAYLKDKNFNLYSKDAIIQLKNVDDSLLLRIRKVYFLKENEILVLLKVPGKDQLRADYWKKTDKVWTRILSESTAGWFEPGKSYDEHNLTYTDFYQNMHGFKGSGDRSFFLAYFPYIPTVITTSFDPDKDYYNLQNDAIKSDELFFGIKEISISLPSD